MTALHFVLNGGGMERNSWWITTIAEFLRKNAKLKDVLSQLKFYSVVAIRNPVEKDLLFPRGRAEVFKGEYLP